MSDSSTALLSSVPDKVILVGDVGVGKTSIFSRFKTGNFEYRGKEAEMQKSWTINDQTVTMTLFDTAGMERHLSTIPHTYFRNAKVLLLVYSIDEVESFDSLTSWIENAVSAHMATGHRECLLGLVGNKLDLESDRKVDISRARQLAENNDIDQEMIFEVSALENTNIEEMFDKIAVKIHPAAAKSATENAKKEGVGDKKIKKCC